MEWLISQSITIFCDSEVSGGATLQVDFTGEEGVLEVTVLKLGPSEDYYHLSVNALTYKDFENKMGVPPADDAAEHKILSMKITIASYEKQFSQHFVD